MARPMTVVGVAAVALLLVLASVVVVVPASAAPEPYDSALAHAMLHMSGAAYCSGASLKNWDCSFCQESDVSNFKPYGVAYNSTTDMLAYVGYEPTRNSVMIAFRGTSLLSILDWLEDLNFFQIERICPGCEIHEGFWYAYQSIRGQFLQYVTQARKAFPTADVVITGHSLGGALAYLAAVDLSLTAGINVTHSYTFGQPRVGNRIFADTWAQIFLEQATFYRVTHGADPVPHVPPMISNFQHRTSHSMQARQQ